MEQAHHGRVGHGLPEVGGAQIGVGVELQDAQIRVERLDRPDSGIGDQMLPAEEDREPAVGQNAATPRPIRSSDAETLPNGRTRLPAS